MPSLISAMSLIISFLAFFGSTVRVNHRLYEVWTMKEFQSITDRTNIAERRFFSLGSSFTLDGIIINSGNMTETILSQSVRHDLKGDSSVTTAPTPPIVLKPGESQIVSITVDVSDMLKYATASDGYSSQISLITRLVQPDGIIKSNIYDFGKVEIFLPGARPFLPRVHNYNLPNGIQNTIDQQQKDLPSYDITANDENSMIPLISSDNMAWLVKGFTWL